MQEGSYALLQTILAVASLGGTLLAHPLGMLLTTVHDCALDCINVGQYLYIGEWSHALHSYIPLMNNSLYLGLFLYGGMQLAVASLAMQVFIGLSQSTSEWKKGRHLEAGGHLLMGMIRGNQLSRQIQLLQMGYQLSAVGEKNEETPTLKVSTKGNFFHNVAYYLQKPVQKTSEFFLRAICTPIRPGTEGNWQNATLEKCRRIAHVAFTLAAAPVTISLYTLGEGMHFCGNTINGTSYTYLPGNGPEKLDDQNLRAMTLNACMLWGGLPIPLGGLRPPGKRIEELAALIREQDPDLLFLQEMSFPASKELFELLKEDYAHCFTRIGPNFMRMESGLTIFSKVGVEKVGFWPFPNQNGIKRGAFYMQTPHNYFVTTHMEAGDAAAERSQQFAQITREIEALKKEKELPCFVLGDFNIDSYKSDREYQSTIGNNPDYFDPNKDNKEESCTNVLLNHMLGKEIDSKHFEKIDYALLHGDPSKVTLNTKLVDTYSIEDPFHAISDHKGLMMDISKKY